MNERTDFIENEQDHDIEVRFGPRGMPLTLRADKR